ncbi:PD-(D/E)XK motif protein [Corynebacterium sp. 335C]
MKLQDIREIWSEIGVPEEGRALYNWRTVATTTGGDEVRVAVDADEGRHLLVPSPERLSENRDSGANLQLYGETVPLPGTHGGIRCLNIFCANSECHHVFDSLIAELVTEIGTSDDPIETTHAIIRAWKRLFTSARPRGLGEKEQIGIFAELKLLQEFIIGEAATDSSIWAGPEKAPHDFETGLLSLEVKGYGADDDGITFHGIDQLANLDDKPLYLLLREVEQVGEEEGETLNELADDIESRIPDRTRFRGLLNSLGVRHDDAKINSNHLRINADHMIEVTERTPRLTRDMLEGGWFPEQITSLKYEMDRRSLLEEDGWSSVPEWMKEMTA